MRTIQGFRKLAILSALLIGCASPLRWTRPNTAAEIADRELAECALQAELNANQGGDEAARLAFVSRLTGLCMRARGFVPTQT